MHNITFSTLYKIVFILFQRVHLDIQVGDHAIDYQDVANKEKLSELQLRVRQLLDQVEQIQKEQNYQRVSIWIDCSFIDLAARLTCQSAVSDEQTIWSRSLYHLIIPLPIVLRCHMLSIACCAVGARMIEQQKILKQKLTTSWSCPL